jgi:hypothetical protein
MSLLFWLGSLIAIGAALAFAVLGVLTLYGGVRATREQLLPGFRPDRPGPVQRFLALAAVWVPVAVVAFFGLYAGVHIVRVVLGLR